MDNGCYTFSRHFLCSYWIPAGAKNGVLLKVLEVEGGVFEVADWLISNDCKKCDLLSARCVTLR